MNIFPAKLIGLYSLVIASAIVFFHLVTSYGEANAKAPISIAGNYVVAGQDLPGCLEHKSLLLGIQQSGIYLNANLIIVDGLVGKEIIDRSATTIRDLRPTFSGRLRDRQLSLSGILPSEICSPPTQLQIAGSINQTSSSSAQLPQPQLQGQLWLTQPDSSHTAPVEFMGMLKPSTHAAQSH